MLGQAFYEATFPANEGEPGELLLSEAIRRAQQQYRSQGADQYLLDTYNLLGDPASVMK